MQKRKPRQLLDDEILYPTDPRRVPLAKSISFLWPMIHFWTILLGIKILLICHNWVYLTRLKNHHPHLKRKNPKRRLLILSNLMWARERKNLVDLAFGLPGSKIRCFLAAPFRTRLQLEVDFLTKRRMTQRKRMSNGTQRWCARRHHSRWDCCFVIGVWWWNDVWPTLGQHRNHQ